MVEVSTGQSIRGSVLCTESSHSTVIRWAQSLMSLSCYSIAPIDFSDAYHAGITVVGTVHHLRIKHIKCYLNRTSALYALIRFTLRFPLKIYGSLCP